jgi:hypothetical protein
MTERPARSTPAFEDRGWPEFIMPWDDTLPGPTDMSFLLEKPAGARGYIQVVDGHLADGGGKRWRMWSVNLCANMPMPPMAYAPTVARRLSKYGINCLRLHSMDHRWPNGVLLRAEKGPPVATFRRGPNPDTQSTRVLDPEAMARLDYFVFCCKREGV